MIIPEKMNVNKLIFLMLFFISCQSKSDKEKVTLLEYNLNEKIKALDSVNNTYIKPLKLYKQAISNKNKIHQDSALAIFKIIISEYPNSFWSCEAQEQIKTIESLKKSLVDVYYILDLNHQKYVIPNDLKRITKGNIVNLYERKAYEAHQKKVKEAKANGTYEFDPESGRDNLNMNIFSFDFIVISKKNIKLTGCELKKLNLVDYDWIKDNSWKPINRNKYKVDFKDLYFLYRINENEYIQYKVGITVTVV